MKTSTITEISIFLQKEEYKAKTEYNKIFSDLWEKYVGTYDEENCSNEEYLFSKMSGVENAGEDKMILQEAKKEYKKIHQLYEEFENQNW